VVVVVPIRLGDAALMAGMNCDRIATSNRMDVMVMRVRVLIIFSLLLAFQNFPHAIP
jgi:hypothetical protein